MKIKIAPIQITILFSALFFSLLLAHVAVVFYGSHFNLLSSDFLSKLFNLDEEKNIPTVYSSALMTFAGLLFLFISTNRKENRYEYFRWLFMFFVMIFLAADEIFQIHEKVTDILRSIHSFEGIFYFAWVIPYSAVSALVFLYLFKFIFNLPAKTTVLLLISGVIFFAGAVGLELFGAKIYFETGGIKTFEFRILSTFGKSLEFIGLLLLSFTLLDYLKNEIKIPSILFNFKRIEYSKDSRISSIKLLEIPDERISKSKNLIIISISIAVFILTIFQIEGSIFNIPFKNFSRDILQIFDSYYYIGAISQLGLFLWASSAAILFFTASIIRSGNEKKMFRYIFFFGILTLILLLDDAFLMHEQLFRITFNMPEKVTQFLYIISAFAIFYFNRKSLFKTNVPILFVALTFLALSIIADKNSDLLGTVAHIFEDGLKFIGILLWFTYSIETCKNLLKLKNS